MCVFEGVNIGKSNGVELWSKSVGCYEVVLIGLAVMCMGDEELRELESNGQIALFEEMIMGLNQTVKKFNSRLGVHVGNKWTIHRRTEQWADLSRKS